MSVEVILYDNLSLRGHVLERKHLKQAESPRQARVQTLESSSTVCHCLSALRFRGRAFAVRSELPTDARLRACDLQGAELNV